MTNRLILMRHAKSGWDDPAASDHERTLTERGRKASDAIGRWLNGKGYLPDVILCSNARRTVETWQLLAPHLPDAEVEFSRALYLATPGEMLAALQARSEQTVLLLAHNPGTAALAAGLTANEINHPGFRSYPTAATCVLDFATDNWREIQPGSGVPVDFVVPRELM